MHPFQRLSLFCALVFLGFVPAHASSIRSGSGPTVSYSGSSASVNYGNDFADLMGRAIKNDNIGGGVKVTDSISVNTSRGAISARATSAVSARAIAKGAAIAGRALPVAGVAIGVGSVIWELLDDNRIRPDGNGGLNFDPGLPESSFTGPCWQDAVFPDRCFGSAGALAGALAARVTQSGWGLPCVITLGTVTPTGPLTAEIQWVQTCPPGAPRSIAEGSLLDGIGAVIKDQKRCAPPPATDGKLWPDGRCGTGNYDKPLTDDQVIDIIARDVTDKKDKVPLVNDILGSPGGAIDLEPGSTTTSGPSSQTGTPPAPVVTSGPGGSVTTTESPGINIRYRGREVQWEPQQVTTKRPGPNPGDPDEEIITDAPDEPSADPQSGVTPDYCLSNPKRAGCSELGDVEPPEWNPDEKPIELKADSPWGSDNASCPPPRTLVIGGKQYQWEWTLVCDFFSGVRFAVIASAWIAAVMIFIGSRADT